MSPTSVSKVRMRKQTVWEGRALRPNDTVEVDATTAQRWASYGIAEVIEGISQTAKATQNDVSQEAAPSVAFETLPHADLLRENGVTTVADTPRTLAELVELEGIGTAKARDILEALNEHR